MCIDTKPLTFVRMYFCAFYKYTYAPYSILIYAPI